MSNYKRYYLDNDYIFITVVTYERQCILLDNIDLLRNAFKKAIEKYKFEIFAIVVLKDHFHIILKLNEYRNFSNIIGSVKKYFSYNIVSNLPQNESSLKRKEKTIWQRRFYEHIIRNDEDLRCHLDYIHYNPIKHSYSNNAKEWKYSSFNKFVGLGYYDIDWCNFEKIVDLNYE